LRGLETGIKHGWFNWQKFDRNTYERLERVENGDMSWIIPEKFLAFASPSPQRGDYQAFTPEDCATVFREMGIGLVVRLNKPQYNRQRFVDKGIKHHELYFLDGSCPSKEIIAKFLDLTERDQGAVGVHCKAGLGRTGTLIGLYAMKHYHFPARAFIGWVRLCRPGSILGPQQQFLVDMESEMFQAGAATRIPRLPSSPSAAASAPGGGFDMTERALAQQAEKLSLKDRSSAEQYEDVGQGERLCNAKRSSGKEHIATHMRSPGLNLAPLEILLPPLCKTVGTVAASERASTEGGICVSAM
jgi:cell division cycle 14